MKRLGTIAVFLALAAAIACAKPKLQSHMYYDQGYDFSKVSSFAIVPGAGGTPENRKLAEDGIRRGLESQGLKSSADLLVQVDLGLRSKVLLSGRMSTGQYAGMAVSMRERKSGRMAWHGVAGLTYYDSLVAAEEIPKAVSMLLADYPPS